jgi:hypothetical protein
VPSLKSGDHASTGIEPAPPRRMYALASRVLCGRARASPEIYAIVKPCRESKHIRFACASAPGLAIV